MQIIFLFIFFAAATAEFLPNGCPVDQQHLLLPHETDCTKFYYCNHGEKVLRECTGGLYFDPNLQVCNWPDNVQCTVTENPVTSTDSTTDIIMTEATTTESTTTETTMTPTSSETTTEITTTPTTTQQTTTQTTAESTTTDISIKPTITEDTTPTIADTTTIRTTVETTMMPTTTKMTTVESTSTKITTTESITTDSNTTPIFIETSPTLTTTTQTTAESTTTDISITPTITEDTTPTIADTTTIRTTVETTMMPTTTKTTTAESTSTKITITESITTDANATPTSTEKITIPTTAESTTTEINITPTITEDTTPTSIHTTTTPTSADTTTIRTTTETSMTATTTKPTTVGNTSTKITTTESITTDTHTTPISTETSPTLTTTTPIITQQTTTPSTAESTTTDISITPTITEDTSPTSIHTTTTPTTTEVTTLPSSTDTTIAVSTTTTTNSEISITPIITDSTTTEITTISTTTVTSITTDINTTPTSISTATENTTTELATSPTITDSTTINTITLPTNTDNTNTPITTEINTSPTATESITSDITSTSTTSDIITTPTLSTRESTTTHITTEIITTPITTENPHSDTTTIPTMTSPITTEATTVETITTPTKTESTSALTTAESAITKTTTMPSATEGTTTGTITTASVPSYTTEDDIPVSFSTETLSTDGVTVPDPIITDSTDFTFTDLTVTDTTELLTTTVKYITTTESEFKTTPSVCPPGTFGNVPHPEMCISYYLCTGGIAIQLFCQEGYEFDPEIRTCAEIGPGGCTFSQTSTADYTSSTDHTSTSAAVTEDATESPAITSPASICPDVPKITFVVPHPDICESYYLCVDGVSTQHFCPEGYEYDTNQWACVPIAPGGCTYGQTTTTPMQTPDVTSPELTTTTSEADTTTEWVQTTTPSVCPPGTFGNVAHPEMCNSYYLCTGGIAIQLFCQEGYEFDPEIRTCAEIGPGGCTFSQTSTADYTSSTDHTSTSAAVTEDATESPAITSPASICPDVPKITFVVPHLDICESYYLCVDGVSTQHFCPEGYEYDTNQWACVPIAPGGCTYGQTTTTPMQTPDVTSPELTTTTSEADTTTEWVQTTTPSVCPPGTFGNVAHPEMCNSYYLCTGGIAIQLFCQEGYEFDPEIRTCAEIGPGGCTFSQTSTADYTSSTDHTSTSAAVTDDATESPAITSPASICPDVPKITFVVPHPDICESYYLCVDGVSTQHFCPEGYEYDTNQWACVPIAPGGCTYGQTTTTPMQTPDVTSPELTTTTSEADTTTEWVQTTTPSVCPPGTFGNVAHPEMCNSYYLCTGGIAIQLFCQEGYEFDPEIRTCAEIGPGGCTFSQTSTADYTSSTDHTSTSAAVTDDATESPAITSPASICPDVPKITFVVPHPDICESYYLCVDGVSTQHFCPEGYEYDTNQWACVPIAPGGCTYGQTTTTPMQTPDVTSPELTTTTSEADTTTEWVQTTTPSVCPPGTFGNVAHPEMCNSYYLCTGGIAIQLFCQEGYEFDPEIRTCAEIGPGGCTFSQTSTADYTSSTDHTSTSAAVTEDATESPAITSPASICPDVPKITFVVPHPDICESYYLCVDGVSTQHFCPEGYEYDTNQWACVPIAPGGCTYGQTTTTPMQTPDVTSPELTTTTSEADTTTEWVQTTTPSVCPPGTFGNVAHPEMCNSYYLCTGGIAIQLFCQEGYEFDPEIRICAEIGPGGCTFSQTSTADYTSSTDHTSTSAAVTDDATESPAITSPASICPDVPKITFVVPHPDICESYYLCVDGVSTQHFCPEGYEYDTNQWACVPIAPGGCTYGQTTTTPMQTPDVTSPELTTTTSEADTTTEWVQTTTPSVCPPGTFGNVAHPEMCNSYYLCTGGIAIQLFCQEGYEFDPEIRTCAEIGPGGCTFSQTSTADYTSSTDHTSTSAAVTDDATESPAITSPASICPDVPKITLVVPHPDICESYYLCVDGVSTQHFCPDGYEYDTNQWACVPIAPGGCTYGQTTTTPMQTPDVTSPELTTTTSEADTTTEWVQTTTPSVCPQGTFGNVAHPEMCNSYYLCTGGIAIQLFCQEGYEFDPEIRTCAEIGPGGCTFSQTSTADYTSSTDHTSTSAAVTDDATESPAITSPASICPDVPKITFVVPHPDICESYYLCVDGVSTQHFCPEGYEYDTNQWACVPIAPGGCTYGQTTTTPMQTPDVTSPELTTTTSEADTTTEWVQTTTSSVCPPGTFGNVAHPEMCNSYYLCTGGIAIQLFCQEGYEFDPEIRTCAEIGPGGCTFSQTSTADYTSSTDHTSTSAAVTDDATESPAITSPASICPDVPKITLVVPHPDICESYYLCVDGVSTQHFCPDGYEYDTNQWACVPIAPGGCTYGQTTTTPMQTPDVTSPELTTTTSEADTTTEWVQTTTPSVCPQGTFGNVAHPEMCNSYYLCTGGIAIQLFCQEGYEFDPEIRTCVEIGPGGCTFSQTSTADYTSSTDHTSTSAAVTDDATESPAITSPASICPDVPKITLVVPHPDICESYYLCVDGVSTQHFCPEGYEYDTNQWACVPIAPGGCTYGQTTTTPMQTSDVTSPELTTTTSEADTTTEWVQTTTPSVCPPGTFGNVAHPEMCNSYYLCTGGIAIQLFCQEGYEFDPEIRTCAEIGPGGCTFSQTSTADYTSSTDHTSTSAAVTDDATESPAITSPASICPDVPKITFVVPHPDICESYYLCVDGVSTQHFCPEGYEYDTNQWACVPIAPGGCTYGQTTTTPMQTPDVTSPELTTTTSEADTTTEWVQTTTPSVCPPGTFGNVAHPEMCNSYYLCTGGIAIQLFCQEGYEFDPEIRTCAEIGPGGCTFSQTSTADYTSSTDHTSTSAAVTDDATESPAITSPASICPDVPKITFVVPHPDICESYYLCVDGVSTQHFCPEGYEYDTNQWACVPIAPGGCTYGQTTTTPMQTPDVTSPELTTTTSEADTTTEWVQTTTSSVCPPGTFGNVAHPEMCNSYYLCTGGIAIQLFCQEGYEYSSDTQQCVMMAGDSCTASRAIKSLYPELRL